MNKKHKIALIVITCTVITLTIFSYNKNRQENKTVSNLVKETYSTNVTIRNNAREKLKIFASKGNSFAMYRYSEILLNLNKIQEAIQLLELSSKAGDKKATFLLGATYILETEQKLKGFNLVNRLAEDGQALAQFYLGMSFNPDSYSEYRLPKNEYLSPYWLILAAKNGDLNAKSMLKLESTKTVKLSDKRKIEETKKVICELDSTSAGC